MLCRTFDYLAGYRIYAPVYGRQICGVEIGDAAVGVPGGGGGGGVSRNGTFPNVRVSTLVEFQELWTRCFEHSH